MGLPSLFISSDLRAASTAGFGKCSPPKHLTLFTAGRLGVTKLLFESSFPVAGLLGVFEALRTLLLPIDELEF